MPARPSVPIVAGAMAFFASGFAALVYQVAWQRILALETGAISCSRTAATPSSAGTTPTTRSRWTRFLPAAPARAASTRWSSSRYARAACARAEVRDYLGSARAERVWAHLAGARSASRLPASAATNRDLDPRDEFNAR